MIKYLLLIFFVSCAWNKEQLRKPVRTQTDLVETLTEKDDKELADRYKVQSMPTGPKKQVVKKRATKKEKEITKTDYPKDYPKKFKNYDNRFKVTWDNYSANYRVGEEMEIDVKYFNVTAGKVILRTMPGKIINGRETYHFRADLKSAPFYKYVYSLDDYIETFMDVEKFRPLKYTLIQRESGQEVDDLQVFDHEKLKTFFWYKRLKKGEIKKENKTAFIPKYFHDSFSALNFTRFLPLKMGDKYEFPIITRTKVWLLKIEVDEFSEVKVGKTTYNSIKLKAETHFPGVLKKKGDILFWLSNDPTRKILKFSAKVKIGTITGELARYK